MKVVIKTTRGGHSTINAEPTDTIRVIKTKIKESPVPLDFTVDSQKIICEGKVLQDDRTLESYGFSENAKDKYLVLMVKKNDLLPTGPPNALPMPANPANTATISSAEPGPSNAGILTTSSVQPSSQSSVVNHLQGTSQTAQIVDVSSDGDQKVLATLEGSQIADFEQLRAMGFSPQATVEAYLCCGKNVEHAARYLSENGNANSSEMSVTDESHTQPDAQTTRRAEMYGVDSDGDKKLLAVLEGDQVDDIEALQALGFSQQATVEAYLLCDKEKERAASFLIENGNDCPSSNSESANNVAKLISSLDGSDIDQIQQLEALGFPHIDALAAYLACSKNAQLAASVLFERGAELNLGSEPVSIISNTPLALPSTGDPESSPTQVSETSGSSATPSQKSLGKQPERPWSLHSDYDRTSENSTTASSDMPSSPPTSLLAELSPRSEPMIIDDSEVEDNFSSEEKVTINKLEKMGFPREAVIEAICACNGDEGCTVEYLYEKGYEI